MKLLESLKFVQGAVAKKNFIPELTHFKIEQGYIRSYNGTIALCAPIDFDVDCMPKAAPFVKAIQKCEDTVTLNMAKSGRLAIKSGNFRAYIDCVEETHVAHVVPEGEPFEVNGEEVLNAFAALLPFISDDASRPWANGVLLRGQSAFATNNVILCEYWVGSQIPYDICIPKAAIVEMLRIKKAPIACQATSQSISFLYDDCWIRSNLLSTQWPDAINKILNSEANPVPVDERFFLGLEDIKDFTDKLGRIYFRPDVMCTHLEAEEGARFKLEGFNYEGVYSVDMLLKLKGIATRYDLTKYPEPCLFFGDRMRGAIIGMHS